MTQEDSKTPAAQVVLSLEERLRTCEQQLAETMARFRSMVELSSDWYWEQDQSFRFTYFSGFLKEKTGLAASWHLGKHRWDTPALNLTEEDWAAHKAQLERREPFHDFEIQRLDAAGAEVWSSLCGRPMFDAAGDYQGYLGVGRDITARKLAERALRESEARFRALTELSADWYWEQDQNLRFVARAGGKATHITGGGEVGRLLWELPILGVSEEQWSGLKQMFAERRPFHDFEYQIETGDGVRHLSITGEPFADERGHFKGYRGIGRDITARKVAEDRIRYLAFHDGLTALPNRANFGQLLQQAILHARRYGRRLAVLFIDLDRFKNINDTLGHQAGDELLQEIGRRLKDGLRASDVVARLGGDEFVVLIQEVVEPRSLAIVARKILHAVLNPMVLQGQECRVTASVGICLFPEDASDEQGLMKKADIAMYRAKEEGKNGYKFYSDQINVHSVERLALETSLRRAVERNEFFLHYQPKINLKTRAITGVEALVRWQHPELGMVPPAQFIPLAEETGLIVPIGRWVLGAACHQNVAWQRAGRPPLSVAVNLSMRQFVDGDLLGDISRALDASGMRPELLELELTESMMMQNLERMSTMLAAIKQRGVRLAVDDFGVGYSSLANLKRFPIDILKIDRSFIREISEQTEDKAITEAIIAMGKTLTMTVVAEGVETQEQQTFLRDHGCDEMQGFHFSRPLTASEMTALLDGQG